MNDIKFKIIVNEDMTEEQKDELAKRVVGSVGMMLGLQTERFNDEENEYLQSQNAELRNQYNLITAENTTLYDAIEKFQGLCKAMGDTEPSKLAKAQIVFEQE